MPSFVLAFIVAAATLGAAGAASALTVDLAGRHFLIAEAAADSPAVAAFYRETGYEAIWTGATPQDRARLQALVDALATASDHGLPRGRYDLETVRGLLTGIGDERALARAEAGLSALLVRFARDLEHGVLVPSEVDPGIVRTVPRRDGAAILRAFSEARDPAAHLAALAPAAPEYARLMKERMRLARAVARDAGGAAVPQATLRPGEAGAGVVALRDRLARMGYLPRTAEPVYGGALQAAVLAFQRDHGLVADGVAGAATLTEINMPAERRLRQVLVAMERERWLNIDRGERHVWVNLTDFSVRIIDAGKVTFETRAVIGMNEADRRSPEFSDEMDHMVINPTWHVPRSITVKEYLPQLQANPYAVGHLVVVDNRGRVIDRGAVDFRQFTARSFPFAMKQPPSPSNALGKVKFMFPNKWNIYLHDTPAKNLFERDVRAFSHGCIRLSDPFDFAYALLSRQTADPVGFFQARLRGGAETYVRLDAPVPIHIVYRTAIAPAKGRVNFRRDVYGRDARIWDALEAAGVVAVPLES